MSVFLESVIIEIFVLILTLLVVITGYFHNAYKYWTKRGVPTVPPTFPFGNNNILLPTGFTVGLISKDFYDHLKNKGHKFGGIYLMTEPNLVLVDPDYVRDILSKDFQHFVDRGFYFNRKDDPISANLFALEGQEWKDLRAKLTPTFTSSKMKTMFQTAVECSKYMLAAIEESSGQSFDAKELTGKFTTDVIGSCAFGVQCNSFEHPDAEFRRMGKRIFYFDFWRSLRALFIVNVPKFSHFLGLTPNNKDVRDFFMKLVSDSIKMRKETGLKRGDFLQILIDLEDSVDFGIEEMAAQVFLFFIAGFDSSSTVMSLALYEMARNPEYQERLREEISNTSAKHDNMITYESISEMKFLDQVFNETIRLYPPGTTLTRRAVKDYPLGDTGVVIEKGTQVIISPMGLHRDPEYFPEPEKFDPERFSEENKKERHPYVFLPFGGGPRNCIGSRFGTMQSKIGIVSVIRSFRISVSPLNKPVRFDPNVFTLKTIDEIYLIAEKV